MKNVRRIVSLIIVVGFAVALGICATASNSDDRPPSTVQIGAAQEVSNLMLNELGRHVVADRTDQGRQIATEWVG